MIDTMEKKVYSSYAEIERDLEILRLERALYLEKMKLSFDHTKQQLEPSNLLRSYFSFSGKFNFSTLASMAKIAFPIIVKFMKKRKERV